MSEWYLRRQTIHYYEPASVGDHDITTLVRVDWPEEKLDEYLALLCRLDELIEEIEEEIGSG